MWVGIVQESVDLHDLTNLRDLADREARLQLLVA